MNPSTAALVESLLWSASEDESGESLLDCGYDPSPELIARLEKDYEKFLAAIQARMPDFDPDIHCLTGQEHQMEHDFIMTRNGHGVGFWEKFDWQAPYGDQLTAICHELGELEVWVGDDGLVYC